MWNQEQIEFEFLKDKYLTTSSRNELSQEDNFHSAVVSIVDVYNHLTEV